MFQAKWCSQNDTLCDIIHFEVIHLPKIKEEQTDWRESALDLHRAHHHSNQLTETKTTPYFSITYAIYYSKKKGFRQYFLAIFQMNPIITRVVKQVEISSHQYSKRQRNEAHSSCHRIAVVCVGLSVNQPHFLFRFFLKPFLTFYAG